ncbi:MAG: tRNA (adenosine(37)-N6)-dimethylallyltransferase MiaA [Chloroflexi bacterium]|nr:tRNA (adenosine(37)-N6)-dimethylallyltransferase MiaA [Chloroflexota bacterium]
MKKLLAVVGPTAVGKSDFAVEASRKFDGEVINADSRQIYRHLDIGTGKPTLDERHSVPHHLFDFVDPDENYSLVLFLKQARAAISDVHARNGLPVLVGGTGQYVWALLEGWQVPEVFPDPETRQLLEDRAVSLGPDALHAELATLDPGAAKNIDARNVRRVVRALEVAYSGLDRRGPVRKSPPPYDVLIVGLTLERAALYDRIDTRVDAMMEAGWPSEVEALLARGYGPELSSMSSVGYAELARLLQGELSLDEAVQKIKYRTHRFARSQYAWFRPDDGRINWFDVADGTDMVLNHVRQWAGRAPWE